MMWFKIASVIPYLVMIWLLFNFWSLACYCRRINKDRMKLSATLMPFARKACEDSDGLCNCVYCEAKNAVISTSKE